MRDDSIWNDVTEMLNLSEPSEISSHWALEEYETKQAIDLNRASNRESKVNIASWI